MYLVVAAVEVEMVVAAAVVPVCAPAKKTMTGFSPKTHRLTHLQIFKIMISLYSYGLCALVSAT